MSIRSIALSLGACALAFALLPSAAQAAPLVVVDPGHGGPYSNANANGLREKTVNLQIALELERELKARGFQVVLTRRTDRAVSLADTATWNWSVSGARWDFTRNGGSGTALIDDLQARVNTANARGADAFVSIHNNGAVSKSARGTEVWSSRIDAQGAALAQRIQKAVVRRTGLRNRGTFRKDFYVCRWSNMPAVIVEGAFISNAQDAKLLKSARIQRAMAAGIADGLEAWLPGLHASSKRSVTGTSTASIAASMSRSVFSGRNSTVILARSDKWRDVAGLPALATVLRAPILWVDKASVPAQTAAEIKRLRPSRLVLAGVDGSFSQQLTAQVQATRPSASINHLTAPDRTGLASAIASAFPEPAASGFVVCDASDDTSLRAAAGIAAAMRERLVLSTAGSFDASTTALLARARSTKQKARIVGTSAVAPAVQGRFKSTTRYTHTDMYARIAAATAGAFPVSARARYRVTIADGSQGPAYLTAAAHAGLKQQPLIAVRGRVLPDLARWWITNRRSSVTGFDVLEMSGAPAPIMETLLKKADAL